MGKIVTVIFRGKKKCTNYLDKKKQKTEIVSRSGIIASIKAETDHKTKGITAKYRFECMTFLFY